MNLEERYPLANEIAELVASTESDIIIEKNIKDRVLSVAYELAIIFEAYKNQQEHKPDKRQLHLPFPSHSGDFNASEFDNAIYGD